MDTPTMGQIFLSEFTGTALLILLGAGVCATVNLNKSKGKGGGWLLINFGWGLAVFVGVYAAWRTGGHLNPAVTIAQVIAGNDLATGVPATVGNVAVYIVAQLTGAIVGAILAWVAFKKQFDETEDPAAILGTFSTGPSVRSYGWNVATEAIGTFVLIAFVLVSGNSPTEIGPLAVALVIVAIGASLGGPTGYAINPARDLGPRIAHAILPIPHKGSSDWSYSWVPVVGPLIGAAIAALIIPPMIG